MTTATSFLDVLLTDGISGADPSRGIQDTSTISRVTESADGVSLSALWTEFADISRLWNEHRIAIADLCSFRTTVVADVVPANMTTDSYEVATEHGIPKAMSQNDFEIRGYDYEDYDLRVAFTWRFLRDSTADQIRGFFTRALDSDAQLQANSVLGRLLDPTPTTNEAGQPVYGLYNADAKPPSFMGRTYSSGYSCYRVSGATVVDSLDLEEQIDALRGHYVGQNAQLITFVNPAQSLAIQGFKAGVESRPKEGAETSGPKSRYDFLPSASAPPRVQMGTIVGQVAPSKLGSLPILGSFGPTWVCETNYMPAGYILTVASHGSNSPLNPVGMREHPKEQYRGMRPVAGNWSYPLQDSFWTHGLGVGVKYRQGAIVTQIKASGTYDIPVIPK